jgi:Fe-Mn family superoxide dismutase
MDLKPLPFQGDLDGISKKTIRTHHGKLYAGYVKKEEEIGARLRELSHGGGVSGANQTYSELRGLKEGETFAVNGVYLHEWYFDVLGGDGNPSGPLADALAEQYGSIENFKEYFTANGMVARGWAVLAWDTHEKGLRIYTGDAHNHGGVWGCMPIIVLDVYEHAYYMDTGSDRKAYIENFWKNLNWQKANELYLEAKRSE